MRRKRVPQRVAADRLDDAREARRALDNPRQGIRMNVVPPNHAAFGVGGPIAGWEYELPSPFEARARVLAGERMRQPCLAESLLEIAPVHEAHAAEMLLQQLHEVLGQHRDAVLPALAVPHDDLAIREIDVLDPQRQAFDLPKPAPYSRAVISLALPVVCSSSRRTSASVSTVGRRTVDPH